MQSCFCQCDIGSRCVVVAQYLFRTLLRKLGTGGIDGLSPLKSGWNQRHIAVLHREHTADAGSDFSLTFCINNCRHAHTESSNTVDVLCQYSHVTFGGTNDELFCLAVKQQAVGGHDLQRESTHSDHPLNFATTSSMEPANRK